MRGGAPAGICRYKTPEQRASPWSCKPPPTDPPHPPVSFTARVATSTIHSSLLATMVFTQGAWLLLSCWVLGTAAHSSHEVRGHDEIECSTESDFSDADLQAIHGPDYYRRRLQTLHRGLPRR